ncbi:LysM peptidoglycan-binding domain-containing protein [Pseudoalteromonas sp. T1lg65]|uniref:LysM peptidoglycan-binding domain-containing protein n=1 Tax=Pseudoalteromonas sp. T1lg65 TaxID=2077101 RepID=UPI003F78ED7F
MRLFFSILLLSLLLLSGCKTTEPEPEVHSTPVANIDKQEKIPAQPITHSKTKPAPDISVTELDDVWKRIKVQLSFPDSQHPRVTERVDWYLQHPNYMEEISRRASPVLHYIVSEVEKRDMPIELALMPLIESDFNLEAYSYKHASGLWQLTPLIAKHYGIKINSWYDGRQDIVDATQVALNFLSYLHKRFDGNWYHAIAAYNTGEGRVISAIRKNEKQGRSIDFFELELPKQTRHYVPKLLAAAQLLKHDLMKFPAIANQPAIQIHPFTQQTVLQQSKEWQDVEALNPGYTRFPALIGGPEHIVLPINRESQWLAMLANQPQVPADTWQQYTIQRGDSLSTIASRFSLSVAELKTFNQLKSDRIRAGKTLILPILADKQLDYTVKAGDSLWRIANQFGVSIAKLKAWNQLSTDVLKIGDTLQVFLSAP